MAVPRGRGLLPSEIQIVADNIAANDIAANDIAAIAIVDVTITNFQQPRQAHRNTPVPHQLVTRRARGYRGAVAAGLHELDPYKPGSPLD